MFIETETMRTARLAQALSKMMFDGADVITFDESGEPLIFERHDVPKDIEQLHPVGDINITHELELIRKYKENNRCSL